MSGGFGNLALQVGRQTKVGGASVVDIITFTESPWGLGMRLFPVQRVVLKAHYGIALDDNARGFDLKAPLPTNLPDYDDVVDSPPRAAQNRIEITDPSEIPKGATITLTDHEGLAITLKEGKQWFADGGVAETTKSISDAIEKFLGSSIEIKVHGETGQVFLISRAFSVHGNKARLEMTPCKGMRVAFPDMEIHQEGYEEHSHNFYGGMGGFYKYRVPITDWRRENEQVFTEAEYLRYLYKEGRSNIAEVTQGHERREMILSIGRRSGKCVVGDTLVLTDNGVRRIDELGDPKGPEYQPFDVGVAQEGGRRSRSAFFYNGGVQPTFRVITYQGAVIEGTGKHRVKAMLPDGTVGWVRLDEVVPGTVFCTQRGANLWAMGPVDLSPYHVPPKRKTAAIQPDVFDENWGLLLGYLVGDGSWTNRASIAVTVEHPETRNELTELFGMLFGRVSFTPDKRLRRTGCVRHHDRAMRAFLDNIGYRWDVKSNTKTTPWVILRSPRPVVRAYLQGLFETDGTVTSDGRTVSFCSASRRLADETRLLLLNFGVTSRIRVNHNRRYGRDYYEVILFGRRSKEVFNEEIGFRSEKKNSPLRENLSRTTKEGGYAESIPFQKAWATRLLQSVPKASPGEGWTRSVLRAALGGICKPGDKTDLTYDRLRVVMPVARDLGADPKTIHHFEEILASDYAFDPVVSIERGKGPVFDLNVPDGESFVANGLTNHNTTISACIAAYESYKLINKGHPQGFYGLPDANVIQIISVATDKDQAGLLYREVHGHFTNCFASETEILTGDGVKEIGPLAGTTQTLLTREGAWVEAPIRSFGKQRLYKVVLQRQGIEKVVYATGDHRWFARDARKPYRGKGWSEFTTKELRPGKHRLQQVFGRSYKNRINPSPYGVAHGFTFGDGHTFKNPRHANQVHLIGEKDQALRPYFSMCPEHARPEINGVEFGALPNFFRELPSIRENKAYLLGWLMGYFAADGSSTKTGQVIISSAIRENIEFVRDVCSLLGIGTYAIRSGVRDSNLTGRPFTMHSMALMRGTLDESFFVIPAHRENFVANGGSNVGKRNWQVKSVEETDRVEEVYCASVEGSRSFVLDGNIATGNCSFFGGYMANATQTFATFQTPYDIDRFGSYKDNSKARYSVKVTFRSCVAKGLRGAGNIVVILDEVAHFTDKGQSGAEEVYNAVTPSTSAFSQKDPDDTTIPIGPVEGRIILISSPLGKQGQFYKLFQIGMRGGKAAQNMLCIEAPTWEVNPTIPSHEFEKHYIKDPAVFFTEYGGMFTDRTRGWIEDAKDLEACIVPLLRPKAKALPRMPHFMGVDIALVGDYSALAVGHNDEQGNIVLDFIERIRAGEGKYVGQERLDFDDVADWIRDVSRRFFITEGMFDQWAGIPLEQALGKRGLKQMQAVHHTRALTSQIYQNFKDMMLDQRLALYDWPLEDGEDHCDYIREILELQAEMVSKYIVLVEAPPVEDKHDDYSDALVRMVWLATKHSRKVIAFAGGRAGLAGQGRGSQRKTLASPSQAVLARTRAKLGGSHPSRQPKRQRSTGLLGPSMFRRR